MKIQPGIKLNCNGIDGTLGLIVIRNAEPDKRYLLSCMHVLDSGHGSGDVFLPDINDNVIAQYSNSTEFSHDGFDAALAEIDPNYYSLLSNQIAGSNKTIATAAYGLPNMELTKTGFVTKKTRSVIDHFTDQFGNLEAGIVLKPHPNGINKYCAQGDSGSVWCSKVTGKAIGLHARGQMGNDFIAAASPIKLILNAFNARIYSPA